MSSGRPRAGGRWARACGVLLFGVLAALGCAAPPQAEPSEDVVAHTGFAFGTRFELRALGVERAELELTLGEAMRRVQQLERCASAWLPGSELRQLNERLARAGRHPLSPELADLMASALEFARRSEGAFDPTVGGWLARAGYYGAQPESTTPTAAGHGHLRLEGDVLVSDIDGLRLDLGGLAKGAACDLAIRHLRERGLAGALVSAGGSAIRAFGSGPDGGPWSVELQVGAHERRVALADRALAVSAQLSEPFFVEGRLASHVIDPRRGAPVEHDTLEWLVGARDARSADLASTALLVMGAEEGLRWLAEQGAGGVVERAMVTRLAPNEAGQGRAPVALEFERGPDAGSWPGWPGERVLD